MSLDLAVLFGSSVLAVAAVVIVLVDTPADAARRVHPDLGPRVVAALVGGALVVALSGWVVAGAVCAVGSWMVVAWWQRRREPTVGEIERTEALASWIENLRDVLMAGDQPIGAINATVASAPPAIRPQVRRLAAGLGRQEPDVVFRRFADELDDPLGDLVAAGLLVAVRRGARTAAVLGSLADQARRQADRRRLVEAERAPVRREVAVLTVVMGALVVALLVLGRAEYLDAYDTARGQVVLGVVLGLYGILLLRVRRLASFPRPGRFLTSPTPPVTADGSSP